MAENTAPVALRWGVEALPEQRRIAALAREVTSLLLAQEGSTPAMDELAAHLERARDALTATAPTSMRARIGDDVEPGGRVYLDHTLDIHAFNPLFPAYEITIEGPDRATGSVNFPICFEGPAGGVNGGVLGVFFDAVVQHHNCALGISGATRDLDLVYRRKTPLLVDLDFEIDRFEEERSVRSEVRIVRDGTVLCSASTRAATFDPALSPVVDGRRPR